MTHAPSAKSRNRTISVAQEAVEAGIPTGVLITFGTISTLIGFWAAACFVGALVAAGGPIALATAWIAAVTGG